MKPFSDKSKSPTKSAFCASLAPINRVNAFTFGLLDRLCCVAVFAMVMMLMRLFLAK